MKNVIQIILICVVLSPVNTYGSSKSNIAATKIMFSSLKSGLESYKSDCGSYPAVSVGLAALSEMPEGNICPEWGPVAYNSCNANSGFFKQIMVKIKKVLGQPLDTHCFVDAWDGPIIYDLIDGKIMLKSFGADKKEGGTGLAKDITSEDY